MHSSFPLHVWKVNKKDEKWNSEIEELQFITDTTVLLP